MSIFAARDPSRSRRSLGSSGTLMSNPNNMVERDAALSLRSKIRLEHAKMRSPAQNKSHLVPETPQYVIETIRAKLRERHAQGPASFLKLFRNIDADDGGTIDFDEFMQFLGYFHMGNDEAVCREVFHRFDPDGSGDICMQEFLEFLIGRPTAGEGENGNSGDGDGGGADGKRTRATMVIGSGQQEVRPPPKDTQSIGLSAVDIIELLREKVENRTPGKGGRVKTSYHFFKQGEEEITRQHFFHVLKNFNIVIDDAEIREEIWRTFDTDGDGTLDFEEFIKHFIADWVC